MRKRLLGVLVLLVGNVMVADAIDTNIVPTPDGYEVYEVPKDGGRHILVRRVGVAKRIPRQDTLRIVYRSGDVQAIGVRWPLTVVGCEMSWSRKQFLVVDECAEWVEFIDAGRPARRRLKEPRIRLFDQRRDDPGRTRHHIAAVYAWHDSVVAEEVKIRLIE